MREAPRQVQHPGHHRHHEHLEQAQPLVGHSGQISNYHSKFSQEVYHSSVLDGGHAEPQPLLAHHLPRVPPEAQGQASCQQVLRVEI